MFEYSSTSRRAGLAAVGTAGLLSALSTFTLLCYITYCCTIGRHKSPMTGGVRSFARTALGRYLVALLASECIQGSAFAMNYYWAAIGAMPNGRTCRAQGIVSQFGDLGSVLFSLAISFHTFSLLFMQTKPAGWVCWCILGLVGIFMFVLPILGSKVIPHLKNRGEFWGSTGAWCWVSGNYQLERYLFVYMWIFINLLCSITLYSLIYLKFKGIITYERNQTSGKRLTFYGSNQTRLGSSQGSHAPNNFDGSQTSDSRENPGHVSNRLIKVAKRLMWYPIVYAIVVVPVSLCRLGVIAGWNPPFGLLVFAGVCFSGSGLSNTLLFVFTRHAYIQRMAYPTIIQITTHRITVTTEPDLGQPKSRSLDEADNAPRIHPTKDVVRYAVEFEADEMGKQPESVGLEDMERNERKDWW